MNVLNWCEFVLSIVTYASFTWAVLFFFKVRGDSGQLGKRVISVCGTLSIVAGLYLNFMYPEENAGKVGVSIFLFCFANLFFWWTYRTVRERPLDFAFSSSTHDYIVRHGPFQYVRHPFYFSYLCAWFGASLATDSPLMLIVPFIMGILYFMAARREESGFLKSSLSSEYQEYKKQTPMLLPLIRFSFSSVLQ